MSRTLIEGRLVDVLANETFPARVTIEDGKIGAIERLSSAPDQFLIPGLVDAHVHIESSMLPPAEFARLAVVHGTVATVSDPHEIANVLGSAGVRYMLEDGARTPFKFLFGVPSCVPATGFESAGAVLGAREVDELLADPRLGYLSEMMNFPGVLGDDPEVMAKIASAKKHGKVIDGHAPGLRGERARKYCAAGISTDHECVSADEARDKLRYGMKIIIREGSAAKNFDALIELAREFPEQIMFCSDDKHPNDLVEGHINQLVARAVRAGIDPLVAVRAATATPAKHYRLKVGLLQQGDPADLAVVDSLEQCRVRATYINGVKVAADGKSLLPRLTSSTPNNFSSREVLPDEFAVTAAGSRLRVVTVADGQLVTGESEVSAKVIDGQAVSDVSRDVLKLAVVNRYMPALPAVAFVKNVGLSRGAIASSVAHDSHNIVAVGVSDDDIASAVNLVMKSRGGIAIADGSSEGVLPLPVAGLMSELDGYTVASQYSEIDARAKELGSTLAAPFMTLSFLALLVIPKLKLSDRGLFDGERFQFASLFAK